MLIVRRDVLAQARNCAGNCSIARLLHTSLQYTVPLFQRKYCWRPEQWRALWRGVPLAYNAHLPTAILECTGIPPPCRRLALMEKARTCQISATSRRSHRTTWGSWSCSRRPAQSRCRPQLQTRRQPERMKSDTIRRLIPAPHP
jgi:hypothetical protein